MGWLTAKALIRLRRLTLDAALCKHMTHYRDRFAWRQAPCAALTACNRLQVKHDLRTMYKHSVNKILTSTGPPLRHWDTLEALGHPLGSLPLMQCLKGVLVPHGWPSASAQPEAESRLLVHSRRPHACPSNQEQ